MTMTDEQVGVRLPDGTVIDATHLAGVAEIATALNQRSDLRRRYPGGITPQMVSSWAREARRGTNGFPAPIITHLGRGQLWDIREAKTWAGPPGRWARPDRGR